MPKFTDQQYLITDQFDAIAALRDDDLGEVGGLLLARADHFHRHTRGFAVEGFLDRLGQLVEVDLLFAGVGIDTDILYDAREVLDWVNAYRLGGARASYREIETPYGHDAFLIEWEQLSAILRTPEET